MCKLLGVVGAKQIRDRKKVVMSSSSPLRNTNERNGRGWFGTRRSAMIRHRRRCLFTARSGSTRKTLSRLCKIDAERQAFMYSTDLAGFVSDPVWISAESNGDDLKEKSTIRTIIAHAKGWRRAMS